ncbi:MAG: putative replicase [Circoviridae sp.]|nr:MAG: putative replicase [Circoviridae sp.]
MAMAKRNYSKRSKIEPSVLTAAFVLPQGAVTSTIDLSQVASLINRRFYRQGINWAVAGFKVISPGNAVGSMSIGQLPNTWVFANSWTKSMSTWMKMNREALAETESVRPKFLDFKIYMDSNHHTAGYANNLLPIDFAGVSATPGEWIPSKAVVPFGPASSGNTAEFEFIGVGANFPGAGASTLNAVSLIEGYAASRGLPYNPDPNTPADADDADGSTPENWMAAIFNEGTDQVSEVIEDMIFENNQPPYPFEGDGLNADTMYPGGANQLSTIQYHDSAIISATTIGGVTTLKGGNFPCGLIRIASTIDTPNTILQINFVPGNHRGYLCEPMTEM